MSLVVGVTGGIGSGKSAATHRFEELGITVVDADLASRLIMEPGKPALQAVAEHFGSRLILADGSLDRATLRTLVFADEQQRHWLEQLTHPLIGQEIVAQLQASKSAYTILSSPLLLEAGQNVLADCVIVVDVPPEVQLQRTIARDSNEESQVRRIMAAQLSREDRLAGADMIIDNAGSLAELQQQVDALHLQLLKRVSAAAE
jgi:dephospho-CoA kinase